MYLHLRKRRISTRPARLVISFSEWRVIRPLLDDFVCGVGMNSQIGGEGADRRERLAGEEISADEGFGGGEDHLIEDGLAWAESDSQVCHINTGTEGTGGSQ